MINRQHFETRETCTGLFRLLFGCRSEIRNVSWSTLCCRCVRLTRVSLIPLCHCPKLELQTRKDEEDTRIKDRARFIAAINCGREFSGVIARSRDMLERRRQRIVSSGTCTDYMMTVCRGNYDMIVGTSIFISSRNNQLNELRS